MARTPPNPENLDQARRRLAARMVELRDETNLSQAAVAERAGITLKTWTRIESGQHNYPRLDSLLRIQFALRVDTLDGLFGSTTDVFGRDEG
jgi:transcriptional regulator with XRE-family HTH domain